MYLALITPNRKVYEGKVSVATFPGTDGSFQILNNHASMISALSRGVLSFQDENKLHKFTIDGGVVEILRNEVMVLTGSILTDLPD